MIKVAVQIPKGTADAAVQNLERYLTDSAGLHAEIAPEAGLLTQDWIREQAQYRHATAARLGGRPTGALERAARSVLTSSDASGAHIQIGSPLLRRAVRDVTIRPGPGKKFLALPVSGEAYGTSPRRFPRQLVFLSKSKDAPTAALTHFRRGSKIGTVHYVLVRQVTQKRDPDLLPSTEVYETRAVEALTKAITRNWEKI